VSSSAATCKPTPAAFAQVERDARGGLLHLDGERRIPPFQVCKRIAQGSNQLKRDLEGVELHRSGSFRGGVHASPPAQAP